MIPHPKRSPLTSQLKLTPSISPKVEADLGIGIGYNYHYHGLFNQRSQNERLLVELSC